MDIGFRIKLAMSSMLSVFLSVSATYGQEYGFEEIHYPDSMDTLVLDINDAGWVVGQFGDIRFGTADNPDTHGFLFDGETYTRISYPNAVSTKAIGLNNQGEVVGEFVDSDKVIRGFHFDGETFREITTPAGEPASAVDINDAGIIVGTFVVSQIPADIRGFELNEGVFQEILVPGADQTLVQSISSDGTIVGTSIIGPVATGFATPMFSPISYSAFGISAANGISSNNVVAGTFLERVDLFTARAFGFLYDIETDDYSEVPFPGVACINHPLESLGQCNKAMHAVNSSGETAGFYDNDDGVFRGFIGRPLGSADVDGDGVVDERDIDELAFALFSGDDDEAFDLDADGVVSIDDHRYLINKLMGTFVGDANLDGQFDSTDLVTVFTAGQYEDDTPENSTWQTGDWNADLEFDSSDLVAAFQDGGYNNGPRATVKSVPEPTGVPSVLLLMSALLLHRFQTAAGCQ